MELNGDGIPDIISGSYVPGDIYIFEGAADGTFERGRILPEEPSSEVERAASAANFADWDGDGKLDLLVGNIVGEVHLALNTGTAEEPKFGKRKPLMAAGKPIQISNDAHPFAVDWDVDGTLDLLVGTGDGGVMFYKGSGSKSPTLAAGEALQAAGKPIKVAHRAKVFPYDWNNDGKLDLLVGNFDYGQDTVGNVYVMIRE